MFDPYLAIDVDDVPVGRTQTRLKTLSPVWNEDVSADIHSGQCIGFTVFHDSAIPPDEFVANCSVAFEDIASKKISDIWVCTLYKRFKADYAVMIYLPLLSICLHIHHLFCVFIFLKISYT